MAIKFYCYEHIHPAISTALRNRGSAVVTAQDVRMLGIADETHLQFADSQGRAVITQDTDFLRLYKSGLSHSGILSAASKQDHKRNNSQFNSGVSNENRKRNGKSCRVFVNWSPGADILVLSTWVFGK